MLALRHPLRLRLRGDYLSITPYLARFSFAPRGHSCISSRCPELLSRPPLAWDAAPRPPSPNTNTYCSGQSLVLTPVPRIHSQSPGFPNLGDSAPGRCYGRHFHSVPGGQRGCRSPVAGQHRERPQPGVSSGGWWVRGGAKTCSFT